MMKIKYIWLMLLLATVWGCETMEDTFEEYRGDGKIRYIGKCTNLELETGWKRFILHWENSSDPIRESIKIVWSTGSVTDSVIIDGNQTSYETEPVFENLSYTFNIYAMDDEGNQSLSTSAYGRPFGPDHETVQSFGRVEQKYFFVGNKLIVHWNTISTPMLDRALHYTSGGQPVALEITDEMINQQYISLADVDAGTEVSISRSALIEGCIDTVNFEPYMLDRKLINLNPDFISAIQQTYNISDVTADFVHNQEELRLNFPLTSMEDVLYFTNVKTVVLGADCYKDEVYAGDKPLTVDDASGSEYALTELNSLMGTTVEVYNNNYGMGALPFANDKGNPVLPEYMPLDHTDWTIELSTAEEGFNSYPENLLDDDVSTVWSPRQIESTLRTHEFKIDMQSEQQVNGFLIRQPYQQQDVFAPFVNVLFSNDGENWEQRQAFSDVQLGLGRGEARYVTLDGAVTARYVKLVVKDRIYYLNRYTSLADFVLF